MQDSLFACVFDWVCRQATALLVVGTVLYLGGCADERLVEIPGYFQGTWHQVAWEEEGYETPWSLLVSGHRIVHTPRGAEAEQYTQVSHSVSGVFRAFGGEIIVIATAGPRSSLGDRRLTLRKTRTPGVIAFGEWVYGWEEDHHFTNGNFAKR